MQFIDKISLRPINSTYFVDIAAVSGARRAFRPRQTRRGPARAPSARALPASTLFRDELELFADSVTGLGRGRSMPRSSLPLSEIVKAARRQARPQ